MRWRFLTSGGDSGTFKYPSRPSNFPPYERRRNWAYFWFGFKLSEFITQPVRYALHSDIACQLFRLSAIDCSSDLLCRSLTETRMLQHVDDCSYLLFYFNIQIWLSTSLRFVDRYPSPPSRRMGFSANLGQF
jgi:hypothetical protein